MKGFFLVFFSREKNDFWFYKELCCKGLLVIVIDKRDGVFCEYYILIRNRLFVVKFNIKDNRIGCIFMCYYYVIILGLVVLFFKKVC